MSTLENYRRIRESGTQFNQKVFGQLTKTDMNNAGRLLGIFHKGVLKFDEEGTGRTEISHFSDFAIFDYYNNDGLTAVQRYLQQLRFNS